MKAIDRSVRQRNRAAVITGGASGIGFATALRLGREGAQVLIVDIDEKALDRTGRHLRDQGVAVLTECASVAVRNDVRRVIWRAERELGGVDILVNGAGIGPEELVVEATDKVLDSLFNVNLKGAFITSSETAKAMIRGRSQGVIIMITSINACLPMPRAVGYSASKAGVEALTRGLAVELAPFQIRVCGVAPGYTDTPMLRKVYEDECEYDAWRRDRVARVPLGRFADAEEIAAAVAFLASPQASYITGTTLVVDGGRLASQ